MNRILTSLIISAIICLPSYSASMPKPIVWSENDISITNSDRGLNQKFSNIYNNHVESGHEMFEKNIKIKKTKNKYLITRARSWAKDSLLKINYSLLYVFKDHDSFTQGYTFFYPQDAYQYSGALKEIKTLTNNQGYLENNSVINGVSLSCYEQEHDGYIERYITAKGKYNYILVESFYPVDLEIYFKSKVDKYLKKITRKIQKFEIEGADYNNDEDDNESMQDDDNQTEY